MTETAGEPEGCGVVELRRYALHPNARDALIEVFEREFVETQEAVGMRIIGTFRDADDPDSFVWLRGFADMLVRGKALKAFYGGPAWAAHARVANATMVDSDNVLLLRPLNRASRLHLDGSGPPPRVARATPAVATLTICPLEPVRAAAVGRLFEREIEPALRRAGANVRAAFMTEHAENNFPALPVREGGEVLVWLSTFADAEARAEHARRTDVRTLLGDYLAGDPEVVRLEPTTRSRLPD
jgi:hypothetical protein